MHSWLAMIIGRLISGEKWEKSTSLDWRLGGSGLLMLPVMLWLFTHVGDDFLKHASVTGIFFYLMGFMLICAVVFWCCFRWIPTKLLYLIAALVWAFVIWRMGFHGLSH